ncbi:MAG: HAD family hydrolase [Candidatus Bipolaricaulota bacterium]|nr:HAD family hydrolase [Candidatus Bipolaricaulota bacterium]MDW8152209.1 HAD family hydrolase [Candidatus Bipolaricaulota bacterium]
MIRAILLDLGGPVFNEDAEYQAWTELLLEELARAGLSVTREEFAAVLQEEIARCEPNPWLSTAWRFVRPDLTKFKTILATFRARNREFQKELPGVFVRPEAKEAILKLAEHYLLALAANQPPRALELLENDGLLTCFRWQEVSDTMGISKPIPLFFRMILDALGVRPEEAVMVGDRLDHDIFPARLLGMSTLRVLVGPYAQQRPLSPLHVPQREVSSLAEVFSALEGMRG